MAVPIFVACFFVYQNRQWFDPTYRERWRIRRKQRKEEAARRKEECKKSRELYAQWKKLPIPENEFDLSLKMDPSITAGLSHFEQVEYQAELLHRRRVAHERDIKKFDASFSKTAQLDIHL